MACKHKGSVWENGWCNVACRYCTLTQETTCEHNRKTNADRIRAMNDRELAEFLAAHDVSQSCQRLREKGYEPTATQISEITFRLVCTYLNWLRMPAEDK